MIRNYRSFVSGPVLHMRFVLIYIQVSSNYLFRTETYIEGLEGFINAAILCNLHQNSSHT